MQRDTLYTVNRWNRPAANRFDWGGNTGLARWDRLASKAYGANYGDTGYTLDDYMTGTTKEQGNNSWLGISKQNNPFSKGNIGNTMGGIAGALGGVANQLALNGIGGGYSTGGVGEGIAGVGNTIGGAVSNVNPLIGAAIQAGSGIIGGVVNRGWGTKENKENINAIEQNTLAARNAGNMMAGMNSNDALLAAAGNMTSGSGFGTTDLVKGGWWSKGKARRKGQKYLNAEENALAAQTHGLTLGVQGVDTALDDEVMGNFAAFGGPMGMAITSPYTELEAVDSIGDNGMGAIEYGFMKDWLLRRQEKDKVKSDMGIGNKLGDGGYFNTPAFLRDQNWVINHLGDWDAQPSEWFHYNSDTGNYQNFAFGGDMQSNGGDYSVGEVYEVSKEEANRLKAMGYEFTVVG